MTASRDLGRSKSSLDKIAIIVGIEQYKNGIPALDTPVADARALATMLRRYGYTLGEEHVTGGQEAIYRNLTGVQLLHLLEQELPRMIRAKSRLIFYFAGHGTRVRLKDGTEPGFLVPADGVAGDSTTYVSMERVRLALDALPSHHKLIILDCCHAGVFRWTSNSIPTRGWTDNRQTYREQYESYLKRPVYQVITSAGQQEKALDTFGKRENNNGHSPFALTLINALDERQGGPALEVMRQDGIILASELTGYLKNHVKQLAKRAHNHDQTPQLFALSEQDSGEFVFETRAFKLANLASLGTKNLYKGWSPYQEDDGWLYFGRETEIEQLTHLIEEKVTASASGQIFVVTGVAKVGKSSLVQAGLVPALKRQNEQRPVSEQWSILYPAADEGESQTAVSKTLAHHREKRGNANGRLLLILDNVDPIIAQSNPKNYLAFLNKAQTEWAGSLHLLITIRASRLPKLLQLAPACHHFMVEPLRERTALQDIVRRPAAQMMLAFEPPTLVDNLIDGFTEPLSLPLLSYLLQQMYATYLAQKEANTPESLTREHYEEIDEALNQNIQVVYDGLEEAERQTMQRILLRLLAPKEDGNSLRLEVPREEFIYAAQSESQRATILIGNLQEKGLLVGDTHVHLAHKRLNTVWDTFNVWQAQMGDRLATQRDLGEAAKRWRENGKPVGQNLWNRHTKLDEMNALARHDLNKLESAFVSQSVVKKERDRRNLGAIVTAVILILSIATGVAFWQRGIAQTQTAEAQRQASIALTKEAFASEQQQIAEDERENALIQEAIALEQQRIAEREKENALAQEAFASTQQKIAETEKENALTQEAIALEQQRIAEAERENALAQEAIALEQKELAQAQEAIAVAKEAFAVEQQRIAEAERENAIAQEAIALEQQRIAEVERENALMQEALAIEQRNIAERERENALAQEAIALEQQRIAEAERENALAQEALALEQKRIAEAERENALAQEAIANEQRRIAEVERENALAQEAIALAQRDEAERQEAIAVRQRNTAQVQSMLVQANNQFAADVNPPLDLFQQTLLMLKQGFAMVMRDDVDVSRQFLSWQAWQLLSELPIPYSAFEEPIIIPSDFLLDVAISPDGKMLAATAQNFDETNRDIYLWDVSTPTSPTRLSTLTAHGDWITSVAFSPDSRTLAAAAGWGGIQLWDVTTPTSVTPLTTQNADNGWVWTVAFSPDGQTLAAVSSFYSDERSAIQLWDVTTPSAATLLTAETLDDIWFSQIIFSPNSQTLATVSNFYDDADNALQLWDVTTPSTITLLTTEMSNDSRFSNVTFSPDGQTLATAIGDEIQLWDVRYPAWATLLTTQSSGSGHVFGVAFSPDSQILAATTGDSLQGQNGGIQLWDVASPASATLFRTLRASRDSLLAFVAFFPGNMTLATVSTHGEVQLWDVENPVSATQPTSLIPNRGPVDDIALSPDGRTLAATYQSITSEYSAVLLWDVTTPTLASPLGDLIAGNGGISNITFSSNGRLLGAVGFSPDTNEDSLLLWDVASSALLHSTIDTRGDIGDIAFSPDGRTLATVTGDEVQLWDITFPASAALLTTLKVDGDPVSEIAFSPDGQTLAAATISYYDERSALQLWDVTVPSAATLLTVETLDNSLVSQIAFSPNSQTLAAAISGEGIRLWDVATPASATLLGSIIGIGSVTDFAFAPDGRTLATNSVGKAQLWDVTVPASATLLTTLTEGGDAFVFFPDGYTLASLNNGGIELWSTLAGLANFACEQSGRNFNWDEWQQFLAGHPYEKTCEQYPVHISLCAQPIEAWPQTHLAERNAVCQTAGS